MFNYLFVVLFWVLSDSGATFRKNVNSENRAVFFDVTKLLAWICVPCSSLIFGTLLVDIVC